MLIPVGTEYRTTVASTVSAEQRCMRCGQSTTVEVSCHGVSKGFQPIWADSDGNDRRNAAAGAAQSDAKLILATARCLKCGRRPRGALAWTALRGPGLWWWLVAPAYLLSALSLFGENAAMLLAPLAGLGMLVHALTVALTLRRCDRSCRRPPADTA